MSRKRKLDVWVASGFTALWSLALICQYFHFSGTAVGLLWGAIVYNFVILGIARIHGLSSEAKIDDYFRFAMGLNSISPLAGLLRKDAEYANAIVATQIATGFAGLIGLVVCAVMVRRSRNASSPQPMNKDSLNGI